MDIGSAVGRKHGVTEEQFYAFDDFETSPAFNEQERAIIRYSIEMSNTPAEVSDSSFAELRRHFNERQIIELTSMIAFENYRSRFNHALGFQAQGFSEGSVCVMPPRVKSMRHESLSRV